MGFSGVRFFLKASPSHSKTLNVDWQLNIRKCIKQCHYFWKVNVEDPLSFCCLRFKCHCNILNKCAYVPVIIWASKVGDLAVIIMPWKKVVLMPFYYTLIEPSVLDVLRADVSVELSAQYGAPRPGVSCVQGLSRDVEVLPWAQKVSCHRVQIVLTVLDPVIVVIAAGESLSAPVIAAAGLPEIIQSEGFGLNIDALSTWRCWHSVWWSPPWQYCSCRRPPWGLFLPPCPGDRLGLTSSSSSARSSWGAELRTTLSQFRRTIWFL